jgi:hypothetical protein
MSFTRKMQELTEKTIISDKLLESTMGKTLSTGLSPKVRASESQ